MSRAVLSHVATTTASPTNVLVKLVPNASVMVYQADGVTPFDQTIYSTLSGGGVLSNPLTANGSGFLEAYAPLPEPVVLTSSGVNYHSAFEPWVTDISLRSELPTNAAAPPFALQGDGSDETADLQAFFDAITSGGAYEIPIGTYGTTATLTLSGVSNVVLHGHPGTVIHQTTAGQGGLRLTACTNVLIDNVNLQGPGTLGDTANGPKTENGIYVVSGSTVVIRQCTVSGFGYKGIESDGAITTIADCDVMGTGENVANSNCTGITIFGGTSSILNCRVDNYTNGLSVQNGTRSKVIGNWVNQTTPPSAINTGSYTNAAYQLYQANHVYGSAKVAFTANDSVMSDNVFTGSGGFSLTHSSGGLCVDNVIDGGSILLSTDDDPGLRPYGLVLRGNHIRRAPIGYADPPTNTIATGAITMGNACRNVIIENNVIEYSYGHAIIGYDAGASAGATQGFENLIIRHNTIRRGSLQGSGSWSAIKLGYGYGESLTGLRVYGNTVESLPSTTSPNAVTALGSSTVTLTSAAEAEKFTPGDLVTGPGIPAGAYVIQMLTTGHSLLLSAAAVAPAPGTITLTRAAMQFKYGLDLSQANNSSPSAVEVRDDNAWGAASDYATGTSAGAATTNTSTLVTLTSMAEVARFQVGTYVTGTNIPGGTYVTDTNPLGPTITLSAAATGTGTVTLTRVAQIAVYGTGIIRRDGLTLRHSNVNHGMSGIAANDAFAVSSAASTDGGLLLQGFSEATQAIILEADAVTNVVTKSSGAAAHVVVDARTRNGAGPGVTTPAVGTNLFAVRSAGLNVFIVEADGDVYITAGAGHTALQTFDAYEDAQLVRLLDTLLSPAEIIVDEFDQFIHYHREDLERLKLVTFNEDNVHFVNMTQLQRLHNGALWQTHTALQRALERIDGLERQMLALGGGAS